MTWRASSISPYNKEHEGEEEEEEEEEEGDAFGFDAEDEDEEEADPSPPVAAGRRKQMPAGPLVERKNAPAAARPHGGSTKLASPVAQRKVGLCRLSPGCKHTSHRFNNRSNHRSSNRSSYRSTELKSGLTMP
jgi:hypothetical protein